MLHCITLAIALVSLPVIFLQMLAARAVDDGGSSLITVFRPAIVCNPYTNPKACIQGCKLMATTVCGISKTLISTEKRDYVGPQKCEWNGITNKERSGLVAMSGRHCTLPTHPSPLHSAQLGPLDLPGFCTSGTVIPSFSNDEAQSAKTGQHSRV